MLSEIIGHNKIKDNIYNKLKSNPIGTFLFYGPASVGKRSVAYVESRVILCGKYEKQCTCNSCVKFNNNTHPDFMCIGRHEKIKVGDVDGVLDFCDTLPFLSNKKIVVIDNVDNITPEASNKLLKIIEEPPSYMSFFLVTSKIDYTSPTIVGRCIKYKFNSLNREDLTNIIWKKMGFELSKAQTLGWLSYNSGLDILSQPGQYLKYRDMAYDFFSGLKNRDFIDSIDYMDKIEKEDTSIFIDLLISILTDILLLNNGIELITNNDIKNDLTKLSKISNYKVLMILLGLISQIKKYSYLNVNLNMNLKSILIKNHSLIESSL